MYRYFISLLQQYSPGDLFEDLQQIINTICRLQLYGLWRMVSTTGLLPSRFDEMSGVGNVEQFFHRATDIFQHHKKA